MLDARKIVRQLIHDDGAISDRDVRAAQQAKFALLGRSGVLHFEPDAAVLRSGRRTATDSSAGSRNASRFLRRPSRHRGSIRHVESAAVGRSGKRQVAGRQSRARQGFGVPLLRLDFAALYNKYHGETERNLRESLQAAEAMAPCVLWCDEIEKGLATSDSDDGVSRRVLGALLTWMSERKAAVFLVATANSIEQLPPELLRKGRFDEIFFVDLPQRSARADAFAIHLQKRGQTPDAFDLAALAAASEGFSGAEIEQAVVAALYATHADARVLDQTALLRALGDTRPLSVIMAERVDWLRQWASERCVPADDPEL
jgi:AAA+ superfamily predicted ATPase